MICLFLESCRKEIEANKGKQFDPTLVESTKELWAYWKETFGRK